MSLQLAAQHLSHQGRGNDSTLVHMSPREVKSLNDLAMAHGGQLSINPNTGLPEAGFLESILPMVAGAALVASGVGPGMAALGVGAGMTLMTGSLEKGLMAGLGAYGGANLGSGLLASGTDAAVAAAPEVAAAQQNAAIQMDKFYNPTSQVLDKGGMEAIQKASMDASAAQTAARTAAAPDFMGKIQAMGKGIGSLGQEGGLSNLYQNLGGSPMSLLKSVGSAAAPAIGEAMTPKKLEEEKADADMGQRYRFSMNPTGGQQQVQPGQDPMANTQSPTTTPFPTPDIYGREQRYFAPSYTKITPEDAKSMYGYADGGVANEAKPTETSALQAFKQMQAQRAAQPQVAYTGGSSPAVGGSPPEQSGNTLNPNVAKTLMQASMTGGIPTSEFERYGGYDKVKALYDTGGGGYGTPTQQTGGSNYMSPAQQNPIPTTVEGLYRTYLGRSPEQGGLDFWNKHFGSSVDADEVARFKLATVPELAANKRLAEQTGGPLAHEFNQYLRETVGTPNQLQAPTAPPPTTTGLADSGYAFNPITQRYSEIKGTAPSTEPAADAFNVDNRPVVGYTAKGEKIYGENKKGPYGTAHWTQGMGSFAASGGLMDSYASGGMSNLGDYSDGGRLLRGPGDGVSDSIPAMIGKRQPARLADGEFVVPARIVSELGNGSTEAGARKLYAMMDRIQKARGKTVGKGKVAKNSRSEKYLPA